MPPYMQCPACQAVSFQAAKAVETAIKKKYNDELIGVVTIEALQDICHDVGFWSNNYGVVPTMNGENSIEGDGVKMDKKADLQTTGEVMVAKAHSQQWGKRIAE